MSKKPEGDFFDEMDDEPGLSPDQEEKIRAKQDEERKQHPKKSTRPLLSWETLGADLNHYLTKDPPTPEWLLLDLMRERTVGAIVATGGTGKSRLLLHLMFCIATVTPFGPFRPVKPRRVLYLCGEDPGEILHERIHAVSRAMNVFGPGDPAGVKGRLLLENFRPVTMVGMDRVLIGRDFSGNPTTTDTYRWLDESLTQVKVDLVVIDPFSRFYGLDENDNPSVTAFVACLEALVKKHRVSILFSHHSSKAIVQEQTRGKADTTRDTGRGASALHDGVRILLSLLSRTSESLGVLEERENDQGFIEVRHVKGNYSPMWKGSYYFEKCPGLLLKPFDPDKGIRGRQVPELVELFPMDGLTGRQILQERAGKKIRDGLKASFPLIKFARDIPLILNLAVQTGRLELVDVPGFNRNGSAGQVYRLPRPSAGKGPDTAEEPIQHQFSESATGADPTAENGGKRQKSKAEAAGKRRKENASAEHGPTKRVPRRKVPRRKNHDSATPTFRRQSGSHGGSQA